MGVAMVQQGFGELTRPLKPVVDPAGWTKEQIAETTDWTHVLNEREIADLDRAIAKVEASGSDLVSVGRDGFEMPVLGPVLGSLRDEIISGRGFVLIRGVPVHRYSRLQSAIAFWGIGTYLGQAVSQNAKGHLLGHVVDLGDKTTDTPHNRGYHTAEMLPSTATAPRTSSAYSVCILQSRAARARWRVRLPFTTKC